MLERRESFAYAAWRRGRHIESMSGLLAFLAAATVLSSTECYRSQTEHVLLANDTYFLNDYKTLLDFQRFEFADGVNDQLVYEMRPRPRRELHALISTFDISNIFKKKKNNGRDGIIDAEPQASLLLSEQSGTVTTVEDERLESEVVNNVITYTVSSLSPHTETFVTEAASEKTTSRGAGEPRMMMIKKKSPDKNKNDTVWPVKHAALVEGDVVLGGLMMVCYRI